MSDFLDYDPEDVLEALEWLEDRGITNVVPYIAEDAPREPVALVRNQRGVKFTIEDGDRMRVIEGEVCLS